ncbi:MAG: zinc-binding alcohol dehydrogenase [Planctomycetes bacterium]|nr:zinc-binding alcohol dehydrogenase [Planctomycetota bacterium]
MKQLLVSPKGSLFFEDRDAPVLDDPNAVLVETAWSAVSAGTEKAIIGRIRENPGMRTDDRRIGYANCGFVRDTGQAVEGVSIGDLVAVYGSDAAFAGHAGASAPRRLNFAKVPDGVAPDEAAFAAIATFPLNGLRLVRPQMGETCVIIGLGLLGLVAVQLAKAMGLVVVGIEPVEERRLVALSVGADFAFAPGDDAITEAVGLYTEGAGADIAVIAAGKSGEPADLAMELLREKGRISFVNGGSPTGSGGGAWHAKELEAYAVKAAGPGRYDESYENDAVDYPIAYVRWTVNRNLKEVLRQMATGGLNMKPLITHRLPFGEAPEAFEMLLAGGGGIIGMAFEHSGGGPQ